MPSASASDGDIPFEERILRAARKEIFESGILGLRVLEVAANAGCSIALIYRYFNDRDGLLAAALERFYLEDYDKMFRIVDERLEAKQNWTLDDIIAVVPKPHFPGSDRRNSMRAELFAAAVHNEVLRKQLSGHLVRYHKRFIVLVEEMVRRLPADQRFDYGLFVHFIFNQTWERNDLLGDRAVTNEQYDSFLRTVLERLRITA